MVTHMIFVVFNLMTHERIGKENIHVLRLAIKVLPQAAFDLWMSSSTDS